MRFPFNDILSMKSRPSIAITYRYTTTLYPQQVKSSQTRLHTTWHFSKDFFRRYCISSDF